MYDIIDINMGCLLFMFSIFITAFSKSEYFFFFIIKMKVEYYLSTLLYSFNSITVYFGFIWIIKSIFFYELMKIINNNDNKITNKRWLLMYDDCWVLNREINVGDDWKNSFKCYLIIQYIFREKILFKRVHV